MAWTDWKNIRQSAGFNDVAVYKVRLVCPDGPVDIPRFLAVDKHGILSIGTTTAMDNRRRQFISGMEKCYGHSSANLLYYLEKYTAIASIFMEHDYEYCFNRVESKNAAAAIEAVSIKSYFIEFGEVPPLNSAIPDRYDEASWSKAVSQQDHE